MFIKLSESAHVCVFPNGFKSQNKSEMTGWVDICRPEAGEFDRDLAGVGPVFRGDLTGVDGKLTGL